MRVSPASKPAPPTGEAAASDRAARQARADIDNLPYEAARDELVTIVARLEGGQVGLEESMRLWERGEALADRCAAWLDGAERRLRREDGTSSAVGELAVDDAGDGGDDEGDDEGGDEGGDPD